MTLREGAALSAYTGILLCKDFNEYQKYIEELMERPVYTHEIPMLAKEIKLRAEKDFKAIIESQVNLNLR